MSASHSTYDEDAAAMHDNAVSPLSFELVKHGATILPVALLPDEATWVRWPRRTAALDPGRTGWAFMLPAELTADQPALIRLDLWMSRRRPFSVIWSAANTEELSVLCCACVADQIGFKHWTKAGTGSAGRVFRHIGLCRSPSFLAVARRLRATVVLEAFPD